MLKQLNRYERIAGAFVAVALFGMGGFLFNYLWQEGWFDQKVTYHTTVTSTEGIHNGSSVEMAGLRVGQVDKIIFDAQGRIQLTVKVLKRFSAQIREDSQIEIARKGLFGDRVLMVKIGDPTLPIIPDGGTLANEESIGIVEILNGRALTPYLTTLTQLFSELKQLTDTFLAKKGSDKYVSAIQDFNGLVKNISKMSDELSKIGKQLNDGERLKITLKTVAAVSEQIYEQLPQLTQAAPTLGQDFSAIVTNLAVLTTELKKVLPALAEVAPDLPRSSRRMVEAIDEAVITLKAMQRSFLFSGGAKEARSEEAEREKKLKEERKPASSPTPPDLKENPAR